MNIKFKAEAFFEFCKANNIELTEWQKEIYNNISDKELFITVSRRFGQKYVADMARNYMVHKMMEERNELELNLNTKI